MGKGWVFGFFVAVGRFGLSVGSVVVAAAVLWFRVLGGSYETTGGEGCVIHMYYATTGRPR